MTNFDYLLKEPSFKSFAQPAVTAEKIYSSDPQIAIAAARKSAEQALKYLVQMEKLNIAESAAFSEMLSDYQIRDLIPGRMLSELKLLKNISTKAVHENPQITDEQAQAVFLILFNFLNWMAYNYSPVESDVYDENRIYNPKLIKEQEQATQSESNLARKQAEETIEIQKKQLEDLKKELEKQKEIAERKIREAYKAQHPNEETTRKAYIDLMLQNAGWKKNRNWREEVAITGMPTQSGSGRADYVLYGDDGIPLAVVEAKKTTGDLAAGRQQAKLYAENLRKKYGRKPVIFLTNGLETRIIDGEYPERKVSDIYSKRDLEKMFNLRSLKENLEPVHSSDRIAGRYYQKAAIAEVCRVLEQKKRKALLVMATGSGKTRTAAALIDYLVRKNCVKNVLFLADRTLLVSQAKKAISNNLPNVSVCNLKDSKDDPDSTVVVSTYQTMLHCIDETEDSQGRLFTPGHFDLIICDEVHRSIYNKYLDIFTYFDAPIIGLTATPKEDVDRDTYKLFELEKGNPTYAYTLEQGVKDKVLVPYKVVETGTSFLDQGIDYDSLTEEEKLDYENQIVNEEGEIISHIKASEINKVLFNKDTIRIVLSTLMKYGLKVDYEDKIGKTIIFARNHRHAEEILKVFKEEYPYLGDDFAQIIDNYAYDAEELRTRFEKANEMPQIAISVDMLDTGVDVPSVLNLVFFKKVMSKTKFWQMVGRGTRLCPGLIDGQDKKEFLIFDFFGNYDYFVHGGPGHDVKANLSISGAIFHKMFEMAYQLQEEEYQTPELQEYRQHLIDIMARQVSSLVRTAFNVHQHLDWVDRFGKPEGYRKITVQDLNEVDHELSHLIQPIKDEIQAIRLDALIYGIELDWLKGQQSKAAFQDLRLKASELQNECLDIPEVFKKKDQINRVLKENSLETMELKDFEEVRKDLRDLIKFIPVNESPTWLTDFADVQDTVEIRPGEFEPVILEGYKKRAESYIQDHKDEEAIRKLRENEPLTNKDYKDLERILWGELGTKADYEAEFQEKPLGEFVRSITGLDQKAAKEAFSKYISEAELDADQINFVNQIIEYLTLNGTMNIGVLMDSPFKELGGVSLFYDDLDKWDKIKRGIKEINERALVH